MLPSKAIDSPVSIGDDGDFSYSSAVDASQSHTQYECKRVILTEPSVIISLNALGDGETFVSSDRNGRVNLWFSSDLSSSNTKAPTETIPLKTFSGWAPALAVLSDGVTIAFGSEDSDGVIEVWGV
jgi:WD40 repeat protein